MTAQTPAIVDVHTHMYPPEYMRILESRNKIPLVRRFSGEPRYIILPDEAESFENSKDDERLPGRPITSHYYSLEQKIHFMDTHGIDKSVISLANPWLDFIAAPEAEETAKVVNQEFSNMCAQYPGRLFFFGTLPLTAPSAVILASIEFIKELKYCRGVILGTSGLGRGLDDAELIPVFESLAAKNLLIFLHPHYGLPNSVWGSRDDFGHVLPLALGFPMETTIAISRMYLADVFTKVPDLKVLLAHSGGTLPFLAGRIESCIMHDAQLTKGNAVPSRRTISQVLKEQIYLDAVIYSEDALKLAIQVCGADRLMFGTDHPFFPPLNRDDNGTWGSATWNLEAIKKASGAYGGNLDPVLGGNAVKLLNLDRDDM